MQISIEPSGPSYGWSHRLAWLLVSLAFMVTCAGGYVATYGASAAMNGYRLIAPIVALMLVVVTLLVWWRDGRKWMRWLALGVIAAVVLVGTLGGLRVFLGEPRLAKLLACTAPLLCALCAAMVTVTSSAWRTGGQLDKHPAARTTQRMALIVTAGIYVLIVLGALLRHPSPGDAYDWFARCLWMDVILTGALGVVVILLLIHVVRRLRERRMLVRRAGLLAGLFFVQTLLGVGAWVTNYGVPGWFRDHVRAIDYTVVARGPLQVWTTTAYVAAGSLLLMTSLAFLLWSFTTPEDK